MAVLELKDVSKTYASGAVAVHAVDRVTLNIERGEFTVIAGPSGSGKTTLLNIMGALDDVSTGRVVLDGDDIGAKSRAALADIRLRKIGFIFQAYNLIPVLTAIENVVFPLVLQGVDKAERRRRGMAILDELGIAQLADKRPNAMSGGQQQRVAVARAIVTRPALVLADEPTANLDSVTGAKLLDTLEALNQQHGMTFVFSSHDEQVINRAHRLILLRDGRIESDTQRQAVTK